MVLFSLAIPLRLKTWSRRLASERSNDHRNLRSGHNSTVGSFRSCVPFGSISCEPQRIRTGQGLVDPEDVLVTDGEQQIETNIFAGQVLKRALGLPEAQRETLLLVYVEGLTYQETAAVLNVPIGTVMSRLAAARLKLSALQAPSRQNDDQEAR